MNSLEDFILTYISEQTIIHPKDIKDKFQKKGYNMERITQAITDIDSEGLISTAQGKTESICLTREGKKAVKMGFAKYLEMKEKENELDSRIKKTTLWGNYINIASAVWGAVGFILGVLTKDQLANLWEWLSAMF
ncbi:hypothetical protein M1B78_05660 [Bacteroides sp. KH569_7]|uniref:Uncharacterized protein n=3 Tax=Bacteroides TaxID=816 RepID=A0A9X2SV18_9BACE|nr:hypothetical protein [Bacteroides muris (ex Fokt et al. 2023)]MCR6505177.1 hypothetical protein [Bacteroides muris (ex Fokt et al. 2023)]MCR6507674.1 hypothetical protein [Bacteroides muris (ex Fokt et al. 2023)]